MAERDPDRDRRVRRRGRRARSRAVLGATFVALTLLGPARAAQAPDLGKLVADVGALDAQGRYQESLERSEHALAALRALGEPSPLQEAFVLFLAADKARLVRDYERALDHVEIAEHLLDGSDWSRALRCQLIGLRAWVELDWGVLDAAARSIAEERACIAQEADRGAAVDSARLNANLHAANLALARGVPSEIEALLAADDAFYCEHPSERAMIELRLANARLEAARRENGDLAAARASLERVIELAPLLPIERTRARGWLATVHLELGDHAAARAAWTIVGRDLDQALAGGAKRERRRWNIVGARLSLETREPAAELERWRTALRAEFAAVLDEWRASKPRDGGYGFLHYDDGLALLNELVALELALDRSSAGVARAFEHVAATHALSWLARKLELADPTIERLRATLVAAEGHGVIVLVPGQRRSHAFALDRDRLDAYELPDLFALDRARRALVRELLDARGERSAAVALADALLPRELRERIAGWSTVGIAGADLMLGDLPIEAIEVTPGRRLGEEKALYAVPTLALGSRAAPAASDEASIALLAAPTLDARVLERNGWRELAIDRDAIDRMLDGYPSDRRHAFVAGDATIERLDLAASGRARVLQFLVHGARDEQSIRPARLALASSAAHASGMVDAADLERVFSGGRAPPLVVLTVCRAGRGALRRGDAGASDLAGALLGAGAFAVVASSFDLDVATATRLSEAFHAELCAGAAPAEALRRARAEFASDPAFAASSDPWLVRLIGVGDAAPFVAPRARTNAPRLWIGAALIATLVAALVVLRRRAR